MFDIKRYPARLLVSFLLLVVPILRMLLFEDYGFLHAEVAVAVLLTLAAAAGLAALGRWPIVFHAEVIVISTLLSFNTVRIDFAPTLRLRWVVGGLAIFLTAAILIMKSRFYPVLALFLAGSFAVDIAKAVAERPHSSPRPANADAGKRYRHVIHLVLDEMVGLAGLPQDCRSCVQARGMLEDIFRKGHFRVYPYAFSNYRDTRDSLSSILNERLLARRNEYFASGDPRPYLRRNRYFVRNARNGYAIRAYQSDFLLYAAPEFPFIVTRTYPSNSLRALHRLRLSWLARLRQLGVIFLQSDRSWWSICTRLLPPEWLPGRVSVGPLATEEVWPVPLLVDCRAASGNTLFFAHLMTPHYPYLYRSDGSIRDLRESQFRWRMHSREEEGAEFRRRYELYGEQVQFLARQLCSFFDDLRATGLYDSATIIVHGDHGSRIRETLEQATPLGSTGNRHESLQDLKIRDLLDAYSTLLAIKRSGASASETVPEKGSVLYFLRREFGKAVAPTEYDALNAVYVFHADGSPQPIPMLKFWQAGGETAPLVNSGE